MSEKKPWEVTAPLRSEAALVSVIVVGTGRGTGAKGACSGTDDDPNKSCSVTDGPDGCSAVGGTTFPDDVSVGAVGAVIIGPVDEDPKKSCAF